MSDLKSLYTVDAHEEGAWLDVLDAKGEKHGLRLHMVGEDSDTYREADAELYKARIESNKKEISHNEVYDELVEKLVKCTKGWDGVEEEFSRSKVRELYRKSPPVFGQVNAFIHDRSEFYRD